MTESGAEVSSGHPANRSHGRAIGLILGRWAILATLGFTVHWFARVGPLAPGDNIEDLVQSTTDRVLWAAALLLFTLAAVAWRQTHAVPTADALAESIVLGVGALWPAVNDRLVLWVGDTGFNYQALFAIASAGALLGLHTSTISRREGTDRATTGSA